MNEEIAENPYGKCPRCGSRQIEQRSYEYPIEWFKCAKCGCWYNEFGEIDEESP